MELLALDPGGTTGWAYCDTDKDEWERGQLAQRPHHMALWELLCTVQPDVLIYERFQYQRRELDRGVSLVLDSVEYIGVTKLWMDTGRLVDCQLVEQTPAQAKNLWSDEKVKALGLWVPGQSHSMDATRHLLYYRVVTLGERALLQKLKPKD
jgi:hypothetical protein